MKRMLIENVTKNNESIERTAQFLPIEIGGLLRHFYEQSRRKQQQEDSKHQATTMVDKELEI